MARQTMVKNEVIGFIEALPIRSVTLSQPYGDARLYPLVSKIAGFSEFKIPGSRDRASLSHAGPRGVRSRRLPLSPPKNAPDGAPRHKWDRGAAPTRAPSSYPARRARTR